VSTRRIVVWFKLSKVVQTDRYCTFPIIAQLQLTFLLF